MEASHILCPAINSFNATPYLRKLTALNSGRVGKTVSLEYKKCLSETWCSVLLAQFVHTNTDLNCALTLFNYPFKSCATMKRPAVPVQQIPVTALRYFV